MPKEEWEVWVHQRTGHQKVSSWQKLCRQENNDAFDLDSRINELK